MARYTFTRESDGAKLETSEHAGLKEATARGKELSEHGHVLIKEEPKAVKAEKSDAPKPKAKGKAKA